MLDINTSLMEAKTFRKTKGDILLRPRTSIPTRELWIHQTPKAMETLQKGLKDAAEGRLTKVRDLKKFAKHSIQPHP